MGAIRIVNADVNDTSHEMQTPDTLGVPATPELQVKAMASVLGMELNSDIQRNQDKLDTLLEYAKTKTTDRSLEGLKWVVRKLGEKINTPSYGEKMIDIMTRYAYLELESLKIKKEKRRLRQ